MANDVTMFKELVEAWRVRLDINSEWFYGEEPAWVTIEDGTRRPNLAMVLQQFLGNANVYADYDDGLKETGDNGFFAVAGQNGAYQVGYVVIDGQVSEIGRIPSGKDLKIIERSIYAALIRSPFGEDDDDSLVWSLRDKFGTPTWLQANSDDGGPSPLAVKFMNDYLGVFLNGIIDPRYMWGVLDKNGYTTDLLLDIYGRVAESSINRWSDRIAPRLGIAPNSIQDPRYLWAVLDSQGHTTDLLLDNDGRIPQSVLDVWSERMGATAGNGPAYSDSSHAPSFQIMSSVSRAVARFSNGEDSPDKITTTELNGQPCKLTRPDYYSHGSPVVLCIYFEGVGGSDRLDVYKAWSDSFVEDSGIVYARSKFHGDSWGNPQSMADARALYDYALRNYNIGGVVLVGASMGGYGACNALTTGTIPDVLGVYLIDGSVNLEARYDGSRHSSIGKAYGVAEDGSDYDEKTAGYDPIKAPVESFKGVPFWINGSQGDNTVNFDQHGLYLAEKLKESNEITIVTYTGGHFNDAHFDSNHFQKFIETVTGGGVFKESN